LDQPAVEALIDSLANHNDKPPLVHVEAGGRPTNPLFSEDYDWQEDKRVREVAHQLSRQHSDALWLGLLNHVDDERYAISYDFNGNTKIKTIGDLCWSKANNDIQWPYRQFIPMDPDTGFRLYTLEVLLSPDDLKEWFAKHKDIPLYQQQLELCELAI